MAEHNTCQQPDRDCPKLMCGYPLPCPYHTAILDLTSKPARVILPVTAEAAWRNRPKLAEIAEILAEGEVDDG